MAVVNVINDLGTITKLPTKTLNILGEQLNLCIGSAIYEAKLAEEDSVILNIGIGNLSIDLVDMQCKFIPSKELKNVIRTSLAEGKDPLEAKLETALVEKLINICSEVI